MAKTVMFEDMSHKNLPDVIAIERQSFKACWTYRDFFQALEQPHCNGIVLTVNKIVAAFCVYEKQLECITIIDFAVGRDWRRRGLGTLLFAKVVARARLLRRPCLQMGLSEYLKDGQLFLKAMGCQFTDSIPCNIHDHDDERAYLFEYIIPRKKG